MDFIAVIGSKDSGKSQFIKSWLNDPSDVTSAKHAISIWTDDADLKIVETDINHVYDFQEIIARCSVYVFVFDPFNDDISIIEKAKEFVFALENRYPILFVLNKLDRIANPPNLKFLDLLKGTYAELRESGMEINLVELSSIFDNDLMGIRKWLNFMRHSFSLKIEELNLLLFKLGKEGPQMIYSHLPSIVFQKELSKEEFIQNFMINSSIQLTQGEAYPKGVFILPGGLSKDFRAITFTWRMEDLDDTRDERLEQGMFFLSIFCPLTSILLTYPYYLLEKRFLKVKDLVHEDINTPTSLPFKILPQIFSEIF